MKFMSVAVLLIMYLSLSLPLANTCSYPKSRMTSSILTLDVCNGSGGGMLISVDMPFVHECQCEPIALKPANYFGTFYSASKPLLIAFQKKRPPKA